MDINGEDRVEAQGAEERAPEALRSGDQERVLDGATERQPDQLAPGAAVRGDVGAVEQGSRPHLGAANDEQALPANITPLRRFGFDLAQAVLARQEQPAPSPYERICQVVRVALPERVPHVFDLNLMEPGTLVDAFFGEEAPAIHLGKGPPRAVPVPLMIFDVDPRGELWRHEYVLIPPMQRLPTNAPVTLRKVLILGAERMLALYEVELPAEQRVPHPEALAMRRHEDAIGGDKDAIHWDRLPEERRKELEEVALKDEVPRLRALARKRWGT